MPTQTLRPNGDGLKEWNLPLFGTHYTEVDETSQDGDSTYIGVTGANNNKRDSFDLSDWSPGSVTISSVRVYFWAKTTGGSPNVRPFLRLSSTNNDGTPLAPASSYTEYSEIIGKPGGGSWTVADINALQAGVYYTDGGGKTDGIRVTQVYVIVTYTSSGTPYPAPTSLECDRQSSPTNASEDPLFTAIFNGDQSGDQAEDAYIEVSEASDFSTTKWDSGWIDIATVNHQSRCEEISYNGTALSSDPPDGNYYWRIKFRDASQRESSWSSTAEFQGINHPWQLTNYAFRRKLLFNRDHPETPSGYVAEFTFHTGNRYKIATNGSYNEAMQEAGYQVEYCNGKTHIVYLAEYGSDQKLGTYIQSRDHLTGQWGTPCKIDDAKTDYDTHHYPTLCIDNNRYIHVFYGCHNSSVYHAKSENANQSGAFAGEGGWTDKTSIGMSGTYPIGFVVPSSNRIYVLCRSQNMLEIVVAYSDNGGSSWTVSRTIVNHTAGDAYRVYCYGCRLDDDERLHIGYSFVKTGNITQGVWYAYSDYESTGDGFNDWYNAAGTQVGTIETAPMDINDNNAIVQSTDEMIYFIRCLILTKDNKPLVLYTYAPAFVTANSDAGVACSWYNSGWQTSWITEDLDIKMRVGRCGIPGIADTDGIIHAFTCVGARRYRRHVPKANGYHTNVSKYPSGGSNYEAIDDGIEKYDGDDTYLYGTGAIEASFTSTDTTSGLINDDIIGVGVEIVAKRITSSPDVRAFLRINNTDYQSDDLQVTNPGYVKYVYVWETNPNTSQPWTASEAQSAEFGFKQLGSGETVRVSRVNRLIHVNYSSHNQLFASELVELLSNDDGQTWSARMLSFNSAIGVPILSIKHHHTNEMIELVWTSGNDIFYYSDNPFGKTLRSAKDLRVLWGNTEIDRVIDYADYSETVIRFPLQETISAGRKAGSKDYYLYLGNPNETSNPKSDPEEVYLHWENVETFDDGDNIHNQRGWTVLAGGAICYESPPSHSNKVTAGDKAIKTTGASIDVRKIFSTTISNAYVLASMWMEQSAERIYLQVLDASDNVISAGLHLTTTTAAYEDGSGWHDSTLRAYKQNMHQVAIQVTSSGCSAWFQGTQIADEVSAITLAKKIKLKCSNESYFDFIAVMQKLQKRVSQTDTTITDASMNYNTSHTAPYDAVNDAKHEVSGLDNIHKVEVKIRAKLLVDQVGINASFHVWVSKNATYDSDDIEDDDTLAISSLIYNTWKSETLTFSDLSETEKSIKTDFYSSNASDPATQIEAEIEEVKVYSMVHDPVIEIGDEETRGILYDAAILGKGHGQITFDAKIDGYKLRITEPVGVEFGGTIQIQKRIKIDHLSTLQSIFRLGIGYLQEVAASQPAPIEFNYTLSHSQRLPVEGRGSLVTADRMPVGFLSSFVDHTRLPVEYGLRIAQANRLPLEWLGTLQAPERLPLGWRCSLVVDNQIPASFLGTFQMNNVLPVESGCRTIITRELPVEALQVLTRCDRLPVEWKGTVKLSVTDRLPMEFQEAFRGDGRLPVEFRSRSIYNQHIPIEFRETFQHLERMPIEWRHRLAIVDHLPLESLRSFVRSNILPIEFGRVFMESSELPIEFCGRFSRSDQVVVDWLQTSRFAQDFYVESLQKAIKKSRYLVEWLERHSTSRTSPVEFRQAVQITERLPVEWQGTVKLSITHRLPLEWRMIVASRDHLAIEYLNRRIVTVTTPTEFGAGATVTVHLPLENKATITDLVARLRAEWTAGLSEVAKFPIDFGTITSDSNRFLIESLEARIISKQLPVEFLGSVKLSVIERLPVTWISTLTEQAQLPIEHRSRLDVISGRLLVDWGTGLTSSQSLSVEYGQAIAVAQQLLTDWVATIDVYGKLAVEWRGHMIDTFRLSVEYSQGFVTETVVPVEFLQTLMIREQLPVDFLGIAIATVCIANATLNTPGLANAMISTAGIRDAILGSAALMNQKLSSAQINAAALKIARIVNQLIKGGGPCH